jgi:hypothetical protein
MMCSCGNPRIESHPTITPVAFRKSRCYNAMEGIRGTLRLRRRSTHDNKFSVPHKACLCFADFVYIVSCSGHAERLRAESLADVPRRIMAGIRSNMSLTVLIITHICVAANSFGQPHNPDLARASRPGKGPLGLDIAFPHRHRRVGMLHSKVFRAVRQSHIGHRSDHRRQRL